MLRVLTRYRGNNDAGVRVEHLPGELIDDPAHEAFLLRDAPGSVERVDAAAATAARQAHAAGAPDAPRIVTGTPDVRVPSHDPDADRVGPDAAMTDRPFGGRLKLNRKAS
jgi:hypothetical protein